MMSNRQIEQALNSLLPTLNNTLPPELVNLALSLLAQSRSRASSLKAEEEIARPYACAEIACKRHKANLKLPTLRGGPPCAPRVYKKLYAYLENVLPAPQTRRRNVVSSTGAASSLPTKPPLHPQMNEPKKKTPLKSTAATSSTTPRKMNLPYKPTKDRKAQSISKDVPPWVMPLIRRLCTAFSAPLLPPHIYAGVSSILHLSGNQEKDAITTLIVGVYILVSKKMHNRQVDDIAYLEQAKCAVQVVGLDLSKREEVDAWVLRITGSGWTAGNEWWENVPEGVLDEDDADIEMEADEEDGERLGKRRRLLPDSAEERGGLLQGLGTMMQEKVDWLSEERRTDYEDWKGGIMKRIHQIEKGKGTEIAVR